MPRIDAHQHFWQFDPVRDNWITDDMEVLQQDFLPDDLHPLLQVNDFDGCVVVQSDQSEKEDEFQLLNAEAFDFIRGIVGWVDLQAEDVEDRLAYYHSFKKMKGFRHVLQGEADRALMLKPAFRNGISKLNKFHFTYDLLIHPDQVGYAAALVQQFPDQRFVVDHLAKPFIKSGDITAWDADIRKLAKFENVSCKISGLVTEADWAHWKLEDFAPYLDVALQAFGTKRVMFGSDWPVCQLAASYEQVLEVVSAYFAGFTEHERELFFGINATKFYHL
ncbi:MAG: amidohydrolase family protein [Bacteroidota bacterium]